MAKLVFDWRVHGWYSQTSASRFVADLSPALFMAPRNYLTHVANFPYGDEAPRSTTADKVLDRVPVPQAAGPFRERRAAAPPGLSHPP